MTEWIEDSELGAGYSQTTFDLGEDPDEEGEIFATLVKADPPDQVQGAVLYVHGFTDYFFQREMSEFFTALGLAFYALDLRKCGRSRRKDHTAHYVSDLALYDDELDQALDLVRAETGTDVVLMGHSTGGLIVPLWLARRIAATEGTSHQAAVKLGVSGLILNSPWFDLQGADWVRGIGTQVIRAAALVRPKDVLRLAGAGLYGRSLSSTADGEWAYNLKLKPLESFPVTVGWLNAVRRGQADLHQGLDVGVPSLVLRSSRSHFAKKFSKTTQSADVVLDVNQIARWSGCLGDHTWVVPIDGALHDVFLSQPEPRQRAYEVVKSWLADREISQRYAPHRTRSRVVPTQVD